MLCEYGCGQEATHRLKNGKWCCNNSFSLCPVIRAKNSEGLKKFYKRSPDKHSCSFRKICSFCGKEITPMNFNRHEKTCYLNPKNKKTCPVCEKVITKVGTTCSSKCACEFFKDKYIEGRSYRVKLYSTICFKHHERKCIICSEDKIVGVHHFDNNHKNDDPRNLIPMCPTHHQYMNSRYKSLIEDKVIEYQKNFSEKFLAPVA